MPSIVAANFRLQPPRIVHTLQSDQCPKGDVYLCLDNPYTYIVHIDCLISVVGGTFITVCSAGLQPLKLKLIQNHDLDI